MDLDIKLENLPNDFSWGTSTAAYQIEGAHNIDGKGPNIWDTFSKIEGTMRDGHNGDIACDHYHKYKEDIQLVKNLAPNYRFSISWSRVLPEGIGAVNQKGIDFYSRLIDEMLENNIEPWLNMYHWDIPQALQDKGGWANRDTVNWFEEYAETLYKAFGNRVKNWAILNEPSVHAYMGHGLGWHAPGIKDPDTYFRVVHNEHRVVGHISRLLQDKDKDLHIGSSYTIMPIRAEDETVNENIVKKYNAIWNENFFLPLFTGKYPEIFRDEFASLIMENDEELIQAKLDYIGLQYYSPIYVKEEENGFLGGNFGSPPAHLNKTDIGWPIEPEGLIESLEWLNNNFSPKKLIITENGASYFDKKINGHINDDYRINYLKQHLQIIGQAIEKGIPLKGYFLWSLLDNLEWNDGYDMRFGAVHVDYDSPELTRTPKESYHWYANLVKSQK